MDFRRSGRLECADEYGLIRGNILVWALFLFFEYPINTGLFKALLVCTPPASLSFGYM